MRQTEKKSPYGWFSYRQNLLALYQDVCARDTDNRSDRLDALIEQTDYREGAPRPGFARQWAHLNDIEAQLFRLMDDSQIRARMPGKFASAEKEGVSDVAGRKVAFEAAQTPDDRRAIAIALMDDLFVRYSYRFSRREKRTEVSRRMTWLGLGIIGLPTLLVFLWPIFVLVIYWLGPNATAQPESVESLRTRADLIFDQASEIAWTSREFAAFFVVMYFGIVGAFFSRLFKYARDMKKLSWTEMDVVYSRGALWVRLLVGAIGAVIVFFLMMGNILSGALFLDGAFTLWVPDGTSTYPGTEKIRPIVPFRPTEDFARLIVWCTLAGFSERFLPDRFGDLNTVASGSVKNGKSDTPEDA